MMQFLNDPEAMQKLANAGNGLVETLQQIRDAAILQNYISALGVANVSNVTVETVLTSAMGYASKSGEGTNPVGEGST